MPFRAATVFLWQNPGESVFFIIRKLKLLLFTKS